MPRESTVKRPKGSDKTHKTEKPVAKAAAKPPARASAVTSPVKTVSVKLAPPAAAAPEKLVPAPAPVEKPAVREAMPMSIRLGDVSSESLVTMPMSEYMNEAQLRFFKDMLLDMKRQLLENAGETSEHLRENDMVPDPADRATIEEEHALELRTRDRERKLMKKIDQALARIEDGSYGYCEETGDPIGLPRLLARPTATLSVEAQQRRELKQKMFGE
jgi:DnaK suppressor protein